MNWTGLEGRLSGGGNWDVRSALLISCECMLKVIKGNLGSDS